MTTWLTYNTTDGVEARRAAVAIIYEQAGGTLLFVKRNERLAFMGGHHAFPGGRVSKFDTGRCIRNADTIAAASYLTAAVRETFEEAGVLLTQGPLPSAETLSAARAAIIASPDRFEPFLDEQGLHIDAALFESAGRWITPSFSPMRFDTRYFLCRRDAPLPATPMAPGEEITDVCWLTPQQALEKRGLGEMVLSTPPAFVLHRLATFALNEALEWLQHTPGFSDSIIDYVEPAPGIHVVPVKAATLPPATHTNCVIVGEKELAIIDPGVVDGAEQKRFTVHLDAICEGVAGRPACVVLTHDHPDHCAFAAGLAGRYEIPIYAHPESLKQFPGGRPLQDGACLELAGPRPWRLQCLHTPGHHPGHCAFFESSTGTLVCGDMAANPGTIMIDPDHGGDMTLYLDSLRRLSACAPTLTVAGHGAPLMEQEGPALFQRTLAHRLMREEKIKAAQAGGARTVKELLPLAYDDTPEALYPLAERQLRAHLLHLEKNRAHPDSAYLTQE